MTEIGPQGEAPLVAAPFGATVTILFTDIRGFTEYTDANGDEASYRMLQHHNALVTEQVERHGGHVVKGLGDSFMVTFEAARTAVACAVGIQKTLEDYNIGERGPRIQVGIGVNTGEPVREAGDLFGGSVNLASRICAAAGPGQILVSDAVRHVVGRMDGIEWRDRGLRELKGFQEPQHLLEVDWGGKSGSVEGPAGSARRQWVSEHSADSGWRRLRRSVWCSLPLWAVWRSLPAESVRRSKGGRQPLDRPRATSSRRPC